MNEPKSLIYEYLEVVGMTAICINVERSPHFRVGRDLAKRTDTHLTYWLDESIAADVVCQAKLATDDKPTVESLKKALHDAAASRKSGLTPHLVIMSRATMLAKKLRQKMEHMRITGQLREFNAEYRRRRIAAEERGVGIMPYSTAMTRLRKAIIVALVGRREIAQMQSIFESVFNEQPLQERRRGAIISR